MAGEAKQIKDASAFIERMLPHMLAGMAFEDAGREVLRRDEKLLLVATAGDEKGTAIREHLCNNAYAALSN